MDIQGSNDVIAYNLSFFGMLLIEQYNWEKEYPEQMRDRRIRMALNVPLVQCGRILPCVTEYHCCDFLGSCEWSTTRPVVELLLPSHDDHVTITMHLAFRHPEHAAAPSTASRHQPWTNTRLRDYYVCWKKLKLNLAKSDSDVRTRRPLPLPRGHKHFPTISRPATNSAWKST